MEIGRGSKTEVRNQKTTIMLHAWMPKHTLGAIKCQKRGLNQRRLKKTDFNKLKALDARLTSVLCRMQ